MSKPSTKIIKRVNSFPNSGCACNSFDSYDRLLCLWQFIQRRVFCNVHNIQVFPRVLNIMSWSSKHLVATQASVTSDNSFTSVHFPLVANQIHVSVIICYNLSAARHSLSGTEWAFHSTRWSNTSKHRACPQTLLCSPRRPLLVFQKNISEMIGDCSAGREQGHSFSQARFIYSEVTICNTTHGPASTRTTPNSFPLTLTDACDGRETQLVELLPHGSRDPNLTIPSWQRNIET